MFGNEIDGAKCYWPIPCGVEEKKASDKLLLFIQIKINTNKQNKNVDRGRLYKKINEIYDK